MHWSLSRLVVFLLALALIVPPAVSSSRAATLVAEATGPGSEIFGMVGRDPLFTLDVDGRTIASAAPAEFLDRMAADMAALGVRWLRIELHASPTHNQPGPGVIEFDRYDHFIREIAPRHGLKVLALLNSGMVAASDPYYSLLRLDDPPDRAGSDPNDRSNNYIRVFSARAGEIAARYGPAIAAYEIFNEPNVNTHRFLLTHGASHEIPAERLATLATRAGLAIKQRQPQATVVLGGLLHGSPIERPQRRPSDYLASVYQAPAVQEFFARRPLGASQLFPWDAVALHPYDLAPWDVETHVREVKARLATLGHADGKIWITEIGKQAEPPPLRSHWLMPPTIQEQEQATFLTDVYRRLMAMPEIVERVFWFKYEDFRENGLPRNWGLVRLRETPGGYYDPALVHYPRKPAYAAYQLLAKPGAFPSSARPAPVGVTAGTRYFAETGQLISGPFLRTWEANGGLARFGLPRTAAFQQGGRLVQYFERARFEHYPEYAGTPNEVQLGLLGQFLIGETAARRAPSPALPASPVTLYLPQTGHNLANGFKAYWEQNNGHRLFGLPLTEEYREINPSNGREYTVQYFERARFEYHPDLRGTPFEIQLGLLGNQILASQYWYR